MKFQECFKEFSRVFQGCFKSVSRARVFQGCFKSVSSVPGPSFRNCAWAQQSRSEKVPGIIFPRGGMIQLRFSLSNILNL